MRIWPSTSARRTVPFVRPTRKELEISPKQDEDGRRRRARAGGRRTGRAHKQVDRLDDVDERLVFAVLDVGPAPARVARRLDRNLGRVLALGSRKGGGRRCQPRPAARAQACAARGTGGGTDDGQVRLDALRRDVHLERVDLRVLRVAKVEDLCGRRQGQGRAQGQPRMPGVRARRPRAGSSSAEQRRRTVEQLVDEHKVVLDALLVELAKVGARDGHEAVDELEHERGRGVGPGTEASKGGGGPRRVSPRAFSSSPRRPTRRAADVTAKPGAGGEGRDALGHGEDIDVVDADVEERRRAERDDGRAHVWVGDDLDPEHVGDRPPSARGVGGQHEGWMRRQEGGAGTDLRSARNRREMRTCEEGQGQGGSAPGRMARTKEAGCQRCSAGRTSPFWLKTKNACSKVGTVKVRTGSRVLGQARRTEIMLAKGSWRGRRGQSLSSAWRARVGPRACACAPPGPARRLASLRDPTRPDDHHQTSTPKQALALQPSLPPLRSCVAGPACFASLVIGLDG